MPRGDKSSYTNKQKRKARAHRRRLHGARRLARRGRAARLGHRQQGKRRRQEERLRPRRARQQVRLARGRSDRRSRGGATSGSGAFPIGEEGRGDAQAARGVPLSTVLAGAQRCATRGHRILDHDAGIRRSVLLHQREQHRRIGRMQPHATLRSARAELRDRRGAMDGVVAAVEDRIRHRRIVEDASSDDCATVFAADKSRSAYRRGRSTPAKCSDARRSTTTNMRCFALSTVTTISAAAEPHASKETANIAAANTAAIPLWRITAPQP